MASQSMAMNLATKIDAKLLLEAVAPRPLAWVTTCAKADARPCIAPFSAITLVSTEPPVLLLVVQPTASGGRKTTAINASETGEFVVNMLARKHLERLMAAAEPDVDGSERFEIGEIDLASGHYVQVPHVADAAYAIECKIQKRDIFDECVELLFADIVAVHISSSFNEEPRPFLGALGFEWFVTKDGMIYIPQEYLGLD